MTWSPEGITSSDVILNNLSLSPLAPSPSATVDRKWGWRWVPGGGGAVLLGYNSPSQPV